MTSAATPRLFSFDAEGVDGCSGAPKVCRPRWATDEGVFATAPAVSDGSVFVIEDAGEASDAELRAYVDPARVAEVLDTPADRFPGGVLPWAIYTWRMVTAELWLRQLAGRPVRALPALTKSDLDLFHT